MRWQDFRRSENVEEAEGGGAPSGFGGGGFRLGGGAIIIVVVVSLLLGKNPLEVLSLLSDGGAPSQPAQTRQVTPGEVAQHNDEKSQQKDFVMAIVGDTEDFWGQTFRNSGRQYEQPKLELFNGRTSSACGLASAAMGPFYCPNDKKVYLDLAFFAELSRRFGAPGDFARAYVIAHEIGHHVQNLTGVMEQAEAQGGMSRGQSATSVRIELQADCYAGVWGHSAAQRGAIDTKDVQEGLAAAAAVGDDRLQQQSQGYVVPESFSHGTSAQRMRWFTTGLKSGDPRSCDTLHAREL